ncbi:MAG TPA: tetratricopeptide repeat protein [Gemmatimonadaceae bacterium]|nr:tetratricopeptide repeat protein [Gemmatimonadaceae bacterium]
MRAAQHAPESERDLAILRSFARRIDPADPGAENNLGVLYFRRGLFDESIAAFSRALALDGRMRVARRNLEIAYGESGVLERRTVELEARLRSSPDDVAALVESGVAEKTAGHLDGAEKKFRRALMHDPESSVLHFFLAEIFYNRGMGEEALTYLRHSIDLNPANPDAHYLAGFILGDLGRIDEAREANRRAVALNPTLSRAEANLSLETTREKRTTPIVSPRVSKTSAKSSSAHLTLAVALRLKGYYTEALRESRAALDAGEDASAALESIGGLHLLLGQPREALDAFDRLLQMTSDAPRIWNQRGVALHLLGRTHEAEGCFRRCLASTPTHAPAHNNLGALKWEAGDARGATNDFRRAVRHDPRLNSARLNLALSLLRQGHFQLALAAYRGVLRASAENPHAWTGVGEVLLKFGDFEGARDACVRAIQSEPRLATAYQSLSIAFAGLGETDASTECLQQAHKLGTQSLQQTMLLEVEGPENRSSALEGNTVAVAVPDYTLAVDYLSKGLYDRALAEIRRSMARGANEREGMLLLGRCFAARGEYDVAEKELIAVLGEVPADDAAALELAGVYRAMGRPRDALRRAIGLVRKNVYHFAALVVLGEALLDLSRTRDAARAFARVLKFNPNHAAARKYSGLAAAEPR